PPDSRHPASSAASRCWPIMVRRGLRCRRRSCAAWPNRPARPRLATGRRRVRLTEGPSTPRSPANRADPARTIRGQGHAALRRCVPLFAAPRGHARRPTSATSPEPPAYDSPAHSASPVPVVKMLQTLWPYTLRVRWEDSLGNPRMRFDTLAVHAGTPPLIIAGAHPTAPPLVPASSYWYDSAAELDRVLGDEQPGYSYARH